MKKYSFSLEVTFKPYFVYLLSNWLYVRAREEEVRWKAGGREFSGHDAVVELQRNKSSLVVCVCACV